MFIAQHIHWTWLFQLLARLRKLKVAYELPNLLGLPPCALKYTRSKFKILKKLFPLEALPLLLETLDEMESTERDVKILTNAMNFEFLIWLKVINLIHQYSLTLSRTFQRVRIDLVETVSLARNSRNELMRIRNDDGSFDKIYDVARSMAKKAEIEIKNKIGVRKQKYHANVDVRPQDFFFRVTVFDPCIVFKLFLSSMSDLLNTNRCWKKNSAVYPGTTCEVPKIGWILPAMPDRRTICSHRWT